MIIIDKSSTVIKETNYTLRGVAAGSHTDTYRIPNVPLSQFSPENIHEMITNMKFCVKYFQIKYKIYAVVGRWFSTFYRIGDPIK